MTASISTTGTHCATVRPAARSWRMSGVGGRVGAEGRRTNGADVNQSESHT